MALEQPLGRDIPINTKGSRRIRYSFSRIPEVMTIPSLIGLQRQSYTDFLQKDIPSEQRKNTGLQGVLHSLFPIYDFSGRVRLDFKGYVLEESKVTLQEARQKSLTYASPLRVTLTLTGFNEDKTEKFQKEQEVYLGDIPLMTRDGTFVVNGVERVVVSQMHRSPGIFFDKESGYSVSGKQMYLARVIPSQGSWMDFEFDSKDLLCVRIDRKRKILVTTLMMALDTGLDYEEITEKDKPSEKKNSKIDDALIAKAKIPGMSREEILQVFYKFRPCAYEDGFWRLPFDEQWKNVVLTEDLLNAETGEVVLPKDTKIQGRHIRQQKEKGVNYVLTPLHSLVGQYLAQDIVDSSTGEVEGRAGEKLTEEKINSLVDKGFYHFDLININDDSGTALLDTLAADKNNNKTEALFEIYRVLRPGETPTLENAYVLFYNLFFNPEKYSLSDVGRLKLNARLSMNVPLSQHVLEKNDFITIIGYLLDLRQGKGYVDDVDSLSNRRVRSVGELLEAQYRSGLLRMQRTIKERMSSVDLDTVMPNDLLNARPLSVVVREFFGTSQLSQFMDQTNPLSEINHKRRISALGPGGLTRDRAGIEVRDVHPTHYGRICPVETPEGANIGLINSMAIYARVNEFGFLETPYRKVEDGHLTDQIHYLSTLEEEHFKIAQADTPIDGKGRFTHERIGCRYRGDFLMIPPEEVDYADVSPKQILSVAASLIPFVENDDPSRALMGSNMQRQGVPLMKSYAPLVGTGVESLVIRDSGVIINAKNSGVVDQVDAGRIVILPDNPQEGDHVVDIYYLDKYRKSNHGTCIHQRPLVQVGDHVEAGDIIADGAATDQGELALGYNALVAFMPFYGYGFEDSIVISQRLVDEDAYTSIHIDELEVVARDMKLGYEEITRDIPGVTEEAIRHLDEAGIAYIGAEVAPGDILVGKVSPKAEAPLNPEEKLLRAIFSDKATDMKDSSLRVPAGVYGTVVDVRVFSRRGIERDERSLAIEKDIIAKITQERDVERRILEQGFKKSLKNILLGKTLSQRFGVYAPGTVITEENFRQLPLSRNKKIFLVEKDIGDKIEDLYKKHDKVIEALNKNFEQKVDKIQRGDDLQTGVLKVVKVFLAVKRKIQPGDKMAGRHGNKGVVSIIVPQEDMPFMADGTPIDVVLNPLGLPARMNVGQILETHLGWASYSLGRKVQKFFREAALLPENEGEQFLRNSLKTIYDKPEMQKKIDDFSPKDLIAFAKDSFKGVPMASPSFEGPKTDKIEELLKFCGVNPSGQEILYNGRTGEPYDRPVTVGILYILKLHHLVDEKIHARSIGPYSLVTQQPLGGKSQFGGQRFGEMEVWALQAYGAARTLLEMLTIKSDDLQGRMDVYKSIINGQEYFTSDVPESFNVLMKELKTLGMNIECHMSHQQEDFHQSMETMINLENSKEKSLKSQEQATKKSSDAQNLPSFDEIHDDKNNEHQDNDFSA